ncbi:MAG: hypothetical protein PHN33_04515 [Candidatus Peribacteraceae bacterium]|nr:hypothetical protein [Candidatus Peribacteraceae bacterium]
MTSADHHEIVEKFIPNEDRKLHSVTPAVIRGVSGRRYLALVLGGNHREVQEGEHYHINSILQELPPAKTAVPDTAPVTKHEPILI